MYSTNQIYIAFLFPDIMAAQVSDSNKNTGDTDGQMHAQQTSSQLKQYQMQSVETRKELDRLLAKRDQFKVSLDNYLKFKIQNKPFKIHKTVSYSHDTKEKKDPAFWYCETVCPGLPKMICESFNNPEYRMEWESNFSSLRKIQIDDTLPNLHILHSCAKAVAGGLISPRDCVELFSTHEFENKATGYRSIQIAAKSIVREDIPKQKGFVRADVLIAGWIFERLSNEERKELGLPNLMVDEGDDVNTKECEWTRIRYIFQSDLKGWLPASVINMGISQTISRMMCDLRNFIIQKRLGLN